MNIAPDTITTLGNLIMDRHSRLLVLGGHGHAGGKTQLTTFAGGDDWYDDISDGPVKREDPPMLGEIRHSVVMLVVRT